MASRTWRILLEDDIHEIKVEHGWWSGVRKIYVDGTLIIEERPLFGADFGSTHNFYVGAYPCVLSIKPAGWNFAFFLDVNGRDAADFFVPADILLRPAQSPAASSDVLLRPSSAKPDATPPRELLRATEKTDAPEV